MPSSRAPTTSIPAFIPLAQGGQRQQSIPQQEPSLSATLQRMEEMFSAMIPPDNHTLEEIFKYLQALDKQVKLIARRVGGIEDC